MSYFEQGYFELGVTSNFSFLRGASRAEELAHQAKALGLAGMGVADHNSLAGIVRAHMAAKHEGLAFAVGVRLVFSDTTPDILAYPQNRAAYGDLCRLLTLGNRRAVKGECLLTREDLISHAHDLSLIVLPPARLNPGFARELQILAQALPQPPWLGASMLFRGDDRKRLHRLSSLGLKLIAVGDVLYHAPERRALQDVMTCIKEHVTLDKAGKLLQANAERHLKTAEEMVRLFRDFPDAIKQTLVFAKQLNFSLDELRYEYPDEALEEGISPQDTLAKLTAMGAAKRYPGGVPLNVQKTILHELSLIAELAYAPYFLTVYDIVKFARSQNILCQGRGSAANSAVCFCLGITEVDPARGDLLFERFISPERKEPPDIDVDFEHERREEVIQYIYGRYGRERAGLAATVITYRSRSAIREVGKVFGLSEDVVGLLAKSNWGSRARGITQEEARRSGLDPADARLSKVLDLTSQLIGFPRHLSQHVGGFVLTRGRLDETIPIGNGAMPDRTFVEWDKDDLDSLGILKIDILALGMLSCIRKAFDFVAHHYGQAYTLASVPAEDAATYKMIQRADTLGVFQIESRAQMTMLPRLKPATFYDLVIEVAIVRPGPIQGDMVHPYLRRRQGFETPVYPAPAPEFGPANELEQVLGKTLGVPLFQEQAMRIAIVAAGFKPVEADNLRRAMATFRRNGTIHSFEAKMVNGMTSRGYALDFALRCFKQIEGFGEYGFPESHAASFALLVYASCWLKCYYPDAFAAALLNAQPMGFYSPAQIVRDVRDHGVEVRPPDINCSDWDATLQLHSPAAARLHPSHISMKQDIRSTHAIRLGLRQIKGLREEDAQKLVQMRNAGYDSLRDLWLRSGLSPAVLERLADADAFNSIGLNRRDALWAVRGLNRAGDKDDLPLFAAMHSREIEPEALLPPMLLGENVVQDYRHLHLSLKAHPLSFIRADLSNMGVVRHQHLSNLSNNCHCIMAGLIICRQRPGTAKGTIFLTLEDETGVSNIIVWPKVFEAFRAVVLGARLIKITGQVQCESGVIHVIAHHLEDMTPLLEKLSQRGSELEALVRADEVKRNISDDPRQTKRAPANLDIGAALDVPARATRHIPAKVGMRNSGNYNLNVVDTNG